jgi:hypothetical protein
MKTAQVLRFAFKRSVKTQIHRIQVMMTRKRIGSQTLVIPPTGSQVVKTSNKRKRQQTRRRPALTGVL